VSTSTGIMYFDGDVENSSTADSAVAVAFATGRTIQSKTLLTLESTTGRSESAGSLTLSAGSGITLLNDVQGIAGGQAMVIASDYESHGDGTLTVWAGRTATSNNGVLTVTAWDVDLAGSLTVGTSSMRLFGSKATQTIGLGTSKDMYLTDTELSRVTSAGGLQVGSSYSGSISVAGIIEASSDT
jgi:hypothetical protein